MPVVATVRCETVEMDPQNGPTATVHGCRVEAGVWSREALPAGWLTVAPININQVSGTFCSWRCLAHFAAGRARLSVFDPQTPHRNGEPEIARLDSQNRIVPLQPSRT